MRSIINWGSRGDYMQTWEKLIEWYHRELYLVLFVNPTTKRERIIECMMIKFMQCVYVYVRTKWIEMSFIYLNSVSETYAYYVCPLCSHCLSLCSTVNCSLDHRLQIIIIKIPYYFWYYFIKNNNILIKKDLKILLKKEQKINTKLLLQLLRDTDWFHGRQDLEGEG